MDMSEAPQGATDSVKALPPVNRPWPMRVLWGIWQSIRLILQLALPVAILAGAVSAGAACGVHRRSRRG